MTEEFIAKLSAAVEEAWGEVKNDVLTDAPEKAESCGYLIEALQEAVRLVRELRAGMSSS
ncbi:MAG TPA: hypothetical protein VIN40_03365 [Candidatus Tyrphobacter sp.]